MLAKCICMCVRATGERRDGECFMRTSLMCCLKNDVFYLQIHPAFFFMVFLLFIVRFGFLELNF